MAHGWHGGVGLVPPGVGLAGQAGRSCGVVAVGNVWDWVTAALIRLAELRRPSPADDRDIYQDINDDEDEDE